MVGLALLLALLTTMPGMAQFGQGPTTMNFQGRLLDSSGEPRGGETHCMRFRMCSDLFCNTQVWPSFSPEEHLVTTESGTYKAGLFTVGLGETYSIPPDLMADNDTLFVEVSVSDQASCPGTDWTTLYPRSEIQASAYAHRSRRVRTSESDDDYLVKVSNSGQGGAIYGETSSTTSEAAAGRFYATAASGTTYGISVSNDSTTDLAAAGSFTAYGASGATDGVVATNYSGSDGARAGSFIALGASGKTYGVHVTNDSTMNDAVAGYFWATGVTGRTEGVHVRNESTTEGARAGHFLANGASGKTYSVVGLNHSSNADSVAGYFHADYGVGVYAWSDYGNLIEAYSSSTDREFYVNNSGDVYIDGTLYETGADFAEMLPGADDLEPGDVLTVGPEGDLTRSTEAYQATVVGVYSTKPAFVGGSDEEMENPGKVPLAVVGVVPVKASAEHGAIQPGDLLVASSTPGHAMRGGDDPPQGTVIGKALEGLESDRGVISMLVTLQ
jgi:hypothetical protein